MPTIRELSDTELKLKIDKVSEFLSLLRKEASRRGMKTSFADKISSWFETDEVSVTTPRKTSIRSTIKKTSPPAGVMEVVSDSDSSDAPPPPKPKQSSNKTTKKTPKKAPTKASKKAETKTKKREVEKATIAEIKAVLDRNNVKYKSRDTKATLLEIATKANMIRTIVNYHNTLH